MEHMEPDKYESADWFNMNFVGFSKSYDCDHYDKNHNTAAAHHNREWIINRRAISVVMETLPVAVPAGGLAGMLINSVELHLLHRP